MASPLVTFQVGPEHREFTMHAAVVTATSPILSELVEKALQGDRFGPLASPIEWPDVEEGVFARFWQFAYTGDMERIRITEYVGPAQPFVIVTPRDRVKSWKRKTRDHMLQSATCWPEVFAENAAIDLVKVYIFAHRYRITGLEEQAYNRLGERLVEYDDMINGKDKLVCESEEAAMMMQLVDFCLQRVDDLPRDLWTLVFSFLACEMKTLRMNEEFIGVLRAYPQVATDIMMMVSEI